MDHSALVRQRLNYNETAVYRDPFTFEEEVATTRSPANRSASPRSPAIGSPITGSPATGSLATRLGATGSSSTFSPLTSRRQKCDRTECKENTENLLASKSKVTDQMLQIIDVNTQLRLENDALKKENLDLRSQCNAAKRQKTSVSKECQREVREIYKSLRSKDLIVGFIIENDIQSRFSSGINQDVVYTIVDEVLKSNAPGRYYKEEVIECCRIYHKSLKDSKARELNGRKELHKKQTARSRILNKKSKRRTSALLHMDNWSPSQKETMKKVLTTEYVSSEEEISQPSSPYKNAGCVRKVRFLPWRSEQVIKNHITLERAFWDKVASPQQKLSRIPIIRSEPSTSIRKVPEDIPEWALKEVSSSDDEYYNK